MVTEPTPFGLNDLALAVDMINEMKIPCGVVVNRDGSGDGGVREYCLRHSIPVLLSIPLDIEIARLYSRGITLLEGMPEWKEAFLRLYRYIEQRVSIGTRTGAE